MGAPDTAALLAATPAALHLPPTFEAEVEAVGPTGLRLRWAAHAERIEAQRAYSCLVAPVPGDRVACWHGSEGVHVLAVLKRRDAAAPQRIELAADCEVQASRITLRADEVNLVYRALLSVGELCKVTVGQLKLAGAMLSTVFDRQVHHAGQHQRTVDGLDRVQAKVLEQQADELLHIQARHVLANGEQLVKVRGAQIHFG
jgi:Protein of unknown function (DUF3540)